MKKTTPKRPLRSRFMGHSFRIKWVNEIAVDGAPSNGSCAVDDAEIEIQNGLVPSIERETLIHEVLHQMLRHGGGIPDAMEETLVHYLGASIATHIDQNKGFWSYVCRDLK